jgi:hypothetical protein
MNVPANLLFDIELAKSRLQEAFKSATNCDDHRNTQPATRQMERSPIKANESPVSRPFRLPEVRGCAGISLQAL